MRACLSVTFDFAMMVDMEFFFVFYCVCVCVCVCLCWFFSAVCVFSIFVASGGYSLVAVCRPLIIVASLVVEHRL